MQSRLRLSDEQLVPARETLRNFGNMSSATVLFVLKHILDLPAEDGDGRICSMAFGPGLTVETALFTKLGDTAAAVAARTDRSGVARAGIRAGLRRTVEFLRERAADAVEQMDLPGCDPARLDRTYAQFALVNRAVSGWRGIYRRAAQAAAPGRLSVHPPGHRLRRR